MDGPQAGARIVVDELGAADGPVVVWLHSEWGLYDDPPLDGSVLTEARVLVVHQPGWGRSTGEEHLGTLQDVATAYWWLLDRLGVVEPVVIAGHGIGATVAAEMAVQQPGRVTSMILAAPFGLWDDQIGGADLFALLPKDIAPHLYADPTGPLAEEQFPTTRTAHERGLAGIRRAQTLGPASRYLYPLPDTGLASRLYRLVDSDVVLLWGARDGVTPVGLAALWQQHVPDAELIFVENAAHMVAYETDDLSTCVRDRVRKARGDLTLSGGS